MNFDVCDEVDGANAFFNESRGTKSGAVIRRLESNLRERLRSEVSVISVAQCVEELVCNSIDASASCVVVTFDPNSFKVIVEDNGVGMLPEDLALLGQRHFTSKCRSLEDLTRVRTLGFRGEAFASVTRLAQFVTVTSRARSRTGVFEVKFERGKMAKEPKRIVATSKFSSGTSVVVLDLFYDFPVRRKAMKSSTEVEKTRRALEALALIHPEISVTFIRSDGVVLVETRKSTSVASTFGALFGSHRVKFLKKVLFKRGDVKICGFISLETHYGKSLQFLFLNKRPLRKTRIHKTINSLLAKSSLCKPGRGGKASPLRCGARVYGIFALNISCPVEDYDVCLDPGKTLVEFKSWDLVDLVITSSVESFLRENGLEEKVEEKEVELSSLLRDRSHVSSSSSTSLASNRSGAGEEAGLPTEGTVALGRDASRRAKTMLDDIVRGFENKRLPDLAKPPRPPSKETMAKLSRFRRSAEPSLTTIKNLPKSSFSSREKNRKTKEDRVSVNPVISIDSDSNHSDALSLVAKQLNTAGSKRSHDEGKGRDTKTSEKSLSKKLQRLSQEAADKRGFGRTGHSTNEQSISRFADEINLKDFCAENTTGFGNFNRLKENQLNLKDFSGQDTEQVKQTTVDPIPPHFDLETLDSVKPQSFGLNFHSDLHEKRVENGRDANRLRDFVDEKKEDKMGEENEDKSKPTLDIHKAFNVSSSDMATPLNLREEELKSPSQNRKDDFIEGEKESDTGIDDGDIEIGEDLDLLVATSTQVIESAKDPKWNKPPSPRKNSGTPDLKGVRRYGCSQETLLRKERVRDLVVVGQWDRKFILALLPAKTDDREDDDLLMIIDQHAAHERIRLERLVREAYRDETLGLSDEPRQRRLKSTTVQPPRQIAISAEEHQLVYKFHSLFENVGLLVSEDGFSQVDGRSKEMRTLFVHAVPQCFVSREITELKQRRSSVLDELVQALVKSQLNLWASGAGASCAALPVTVRNVLNSRACKGAVKFGDALDAARCSEILSELGACRNPFECAHGRPTIHPLVDMGRLEQDFPDSSRLKTLSKLIKGQMNLLEI